jgi:hypothetical protein
LTTRPLLWSSGIIPCFLPLFAARFNPYPSLHFLFYPSLSEEIANPPNCPHYRSIRLFSLINSLSSRHPTLRITHRHIQAQHPNPKQCQLSETPKPEPQPHPLAQALNPPPAGAKIRRPCCSIMFSGSARKIGRLLYLVKLEKK